MRCYFKKRTENLCSHCDIYRTTHHNRLRIRQRHVPNPVYDLLKEDLSSKLNTTRTKRSTVHPKKYINDAMSGFDNELKSYPVPKRARSRRTIRRGMQRIGKTFGSFRKGLNGFNKGIGIIGCVKDLCGCAAGTVNVSKHICS